MIQKMRRTQHSPISPHGNHQIDIGQMLSIQFDTINTGKRNVVVAENGEEGFDTGFVGVVAWFETGPSEGFGGLSS